MSCACNSLTGGISKNCGGNIGGIKKIYITNLCNVTSLVENSSGEIGTINMDGATVFYDFEFNKYSSTFEEAISGDVAVGTQINTQTVTLVLAKREKTKRDALQLLMAFNELAVIVEDFNGLYWYLGEQNGLIMTTNTSVSGKAAADANGYTIVMTGVETQFANEVTAAALAANI